MRKISENEWMHSNHPDWTLETNSRQVEALLSYTLRYLGMSGFSVYVGDQKVRIQLPDGDVFYYMFSATRAERFHHIGFLVDYIMHRMDES